MNDIQFAEYMDALADKHANRIINALVKLENRISALTISAPDNAGALFDLEWAINARDQLRVILQEEYLVDVDELIRSYDESEIEAYKMMEQYSDFTRLDRSIINQLKTLTFQGFDDVASTFINEIADEMYSYTLTGRNKADMVQSIRHKINGVYAATDDEEASRLVAIAQNGTEEESKDAVNKLHTLYARDRLGRNLRRYSVQMAQDSIMQYNQRVILRSAMESGVDKWKYTGSVVRDSREFCVKHAGQKFTTEQYLKTWESEEWAGKAQGDPFIVRGGYNCRHILRPSRR